MAMLRKEGLTRLLILFLLAFTVVMHIAGTVFVGFTWSVPRGEVLNGPASSLAFIIANSSFSIVGALIAWSRPANLIGRLCLTTSIIGHDVSLGRYLAYTLLIEPETSLPSLQAAVALMANAWMVGASCFLILLIVFPSGRAATRGMALVAWTLPVLAVSVLALSAVQPGRLPPPFEQYENVLGVRGFDLSGELASALTAVFALLGVVAAVDMLRRFLRSSGEERQQFKWFAYITAWIPPLMVLWLIVSLVNPDGLYLLDPTLPVLLTSVTIAIGIAVLKHGLYDIDRIINRTLVYGLLTAVLAALYFGLVVGLQALLSPLSGSSDLAIALTTLAVAALFLPARGRVQAIVDRRFNRRGYDAARTVEGFSLRLREEIDLDTLRSELQAVLNETMQPAGASLWLRPQEQTR